MIVLVNRGDGLGTRLQVIMQARAVAAELGARLIIEWPPIGAPFYAHGRMLEKKGLGGVLEGNHFFKREDFLRGEIVETGEIDHQSLLSVSSLSGQRHTRSEICERLVGKSGIFYDLPEGIFDVFREAKEEDTSFKNGWREMNWSADFITLINNTVGNDLLCGLVAIHARRGDIMAMLAGASFEYLEMQGMEQLLQRFVALETFLEKIKEREISGPIFIAGEDGELFRFLKGRVENEIFQIDREKVICETTRTFMDFYILSMCNLVIAPYHSYFSGAAALVGRSSIDRIHPEVPAALEELFCYLKGTARSDQKEVKALMLRTFARMMLHT